MLYGLIAARYSTDPIDWIVAVPFLFAGWKAWNYISDLTPPDDGAEFGAAGKIFVVIMVLGALFVGTRLLIKKVAGV